MSCFALWYQNNQASLNGPCAVCIDGVSFSNMGLPIMVNKLGILRRNEGRDAAVSRVMSFTAGENSKNERERVDGKIGTSTSQT